MTKEETLLFLLEEAIRACDAAIEEGQKKGVAWLVEDASNARNQFVQLAKLASSGLVGPSGGGGLGITRALSEWAPEYLYTAGEAVEDFYMRNW